MDKVKLNELLTAQTIAARAVSRTIINTKKIGLSNLTVPVLRNRLQVLEETWKGIQNNHIQIDNYAGEEKTALPYYTNDGYTATEKAYLAASDFLYQLIADATPTGSTTEVDRSTVLATNPVQQVKLPPVKIPTFSGDYLEWESYYDQFTALIINNTQLQDVHRLQYLKASLTGEASLVLKNVAVTELNYASALETLKNRYDNSRAIVNAHLQNFFNIPTVGTELLRDLKQLRDRSHEMVTALKNRNRPVEAWDDLLVFFIVSKFDKQTRRKWETRLGETNGHPTYNELERFLSTYIRTLEAVAPETSMSNSRFSFRQKTQKINETKTHLSTSSVRCLVCDANHPLHQCEVFRNKSTAERSALVREKRCCFNCLKQGHVPKECPSKNVCRNCKRKHHTLIHSETVNASNRYVKPREQEATESRLGVQYSVTEVVPSSALPTTSNAMSCITEEKRLKGQSVILATAWARVRTESQRSMIVRVLLDQGSQSSFVTETVAQSLRAPRQRIATIITGLGGEPTSRANTVARLTIEPCTPGGPVIPLNALVLKKLTSYNPVRLPGQDSWRHLRGLEFADGKAQGLEPIQLLVGADIYGAIIMNGLRKGPVDAPIAQKTIFGWVISGPGSKMLRDKQKINVLHSPCYDDLDKSLKRFWEIEELPKQSLLTLEDSRCENHFSKTHSRTTDGRYVVRLPFKKDPPLNLGDSKNKAAALFYRLEGRLNRNPELAAAYREFLNEYESLGHMQAVDPSESAASREVYFPHHPVLRKSSSTTKLRVVFNASSPTSNGSTLNDHLLTGPNLQCELASIILRWRSFRYVYTADMAKIFRQIIVDPRDVDYQRILWRSSTETPLRAYRLLTVTYGTACAPYLANRVIKQLALDEGNRFPLAVSVLEKHIYVDDALFGADDLILARQTKDQVTALLRAGGFHLRKWMSNRPELLRDIGLDDHELASNHILQEGEGLKVLGILWNPVEDAFGFQTNLPSDPKPTKRQVLSIISCIFDPLGWASPVVISAKIFTQTLWKSKLGWDELLPDDAKKDWQRYYSQLKDLDNSSIPRWTSQGSSVVRSEIHGFSDASNSAYAAVTYLRTVTMFDTVQISLLMAKTKVAPIKFMSIPRLELSAANLLARVVETVQSAMELSSVPVYCWTDSTIVLAWLAKEPATSKTFVANRTTEIHHKLPTAQWRHVPTEHNPADCASRGIPAPDLHTHPLWWRGPTWLTEPAEGWPNHIPPLEPGIYLEEKRVSPVVLLNVEANFEVAENLSSWPRLLRVTAYMFRFVNLPRTKGRLHKDLAITVDEINYAREFWITKVQALHFSKELRDLRNGRAVAKTSCLRKLDPFIDDSGIIRVGGRLRRSPLQYGSKFPVVLPRHRISDLIITQAHSQVLHGGVQITLRVLRERFWILGARNLVKTHILRCVTCVRQRARVGQQLMGELPSVRVNPARPFSCSGVDYAGPILTRVAPGRGYKSQKSYIAIFVCLATRAIHLELVSDCSTTSFLAAFHRFSSRRGLPSEMYSDNGLNFQGADKELTTAFRAVIRDPDLRTRLASDGTAWHFQPPYAPHFGGIWEAGVKSVKKHLYRILGSRTPTFEELTTLLYQIEAVLNSRPIAPLTDSVDEFDALTPGHFLVGSTLRTAPMPSLLDVKENRLSRWQLVRRMLEEFWKVWSSDYLNTLQQRQKWSKREPDLRIGNLVLMRNPNLPPSKWALGRVLECHPGNDGLTRVVTIKTAQSVFKRPITQLCKLPVNSEGNP